MQVARLKLIALLSAAVLISSGSSWAYEEMAVIGGGAITGKVTMTGGKPTPKGFNLITFPDPVYCGRISTGTGWRILDEFTMAGDRGLKDVVVLLTDAKKGKSFKFEAPTIEAKDCRFLPFITVVKDRAEVTVMNMDPVMHDIQAYETSHLGPRVLFNTPLPMNPHHKRNVDADTHEHLAGQPMTQVIHMTKGRRFFVMQCGFHAYMESWGMAVDNPYYALTGADGTFSLSDVPPGEYTLMAWHPSVGAPLESKVTVSAKGSVQKDFVFSAPIGRRSAHEIQENPHYGMEALGKSLEIRPTLELQKP
ncbi:MAG TPA: carboxypeptidase-like regulatory domain-containing protein [Nitrospiraceae bacterium]|nr:carboxypeptidase-like regulatory domain-containing protein [Nitrospiraceae bacterium]